MKKGVKLILLTMLFAAFVGLFSVHINAEADFKVKYELKFDKNTYKSGDTAVLDIILTDTDDEAQVDGFKLGSFQTSVLIDSSKLTYIDGSIDKGITDSCEYATAEVRAASVKDSSDQIIVTAFSSLQGAPFKQGGGVIASLRFEVKAKAGEKISASFETEKHDNVAMLPYDGKLTVDYNGTKRDKVFNCTFANAEANVRDYIVENPVAKADGTAVTGGVTIRKPENKPAVLLAALYNTETQLPAADVIIKPVTAADTVFGSEDIKFENIKNTQNLEIRYFLWEDTVSMRCLSEKLTAAVQ